MTGSRLRGALPLLPAALTVGLAFRAGGFFPDAVGIVCAVLLLALIARVTLANRPFAGWSVGLGVAAGAMVLFSVWTLASALWSDAPVRALVEFDRALAYTLLLVVMGAFATRAGDLDRLLVAMAAVIGLVAIAALATRLAPSTFAAGEGLFPARLSFPVTYWNTLGVFCALGIVFSVHCTAGGAQGVVVRVLGAALVPVLSVALYFTFSRGAIVTVAIGAVAYVVLGHPRRLATGLLAALPPTAVAVMVAYGEGDLASARFADVPDAGERVGLVLAACAAAAAVLRLAAVAIDRRIDRVRVDRVRRRRVLGSAAAVVAAAAVITVVFTGAAGETADQVDAFAQAGPIEETADQRSRLTQVGANGRVEHWRVSVDGFESSPLRGTGAGTYRLEWELRRPFAVKVVDGHSLYAETLGELGIVGLLLLVIAPLTALAAASRRLFSAERHAHAAFIAAGVALLVHAGIDWDWEMPVVFVWFFAASGIVLARRDDLPPRGWSPDRFPRVLAGLGLLLLAVTPVTVALSQLSLNRAGDAFAAGDCKRATDGALGSIDLLRARPEPFEIVAYCNLRAGQFDLGVQAMRAASDRDPHDWRYAYGLAVAQAFAGGDPREAAARAVRLNPREPQARELARRLRAADPDRWGRVAARARIPTR